MATRKEGHSFASNEFQTKQVDFEEEKHEHWAHNGHLKSIELQSHYTQFVQAINQALTEATLAGFHHAKASGEALLNLPEITSDMVNATQAMLEQLNWWPEARGDVEAGERMSPYGFPERYIYLGDARELVQYIPDHSIDLIFTDPPYVRDSIDSYGWLAQEASRILAPNGFLMAYVGNYWKDEAMVQMREHMAYFWDYTIIHGKAQPLQRNRNTRSTTKSILCYRLPGSTSLPNVEVKSAYQGSSASKEYHPWGQPVDEATYYIRCFSEPDDLVLDPFIGGGTTAVACEQSNRSWLGFEMDPRHARVAQNRVEGLRSSEPLN